MVLTKPMQPIDWSAWSRDAVKQMQARNARWQEHWQLKGAAYQWELEAATLTFTTPQGQVMAELCVAGTLVEYDEFLWGWANDTLPAAATAPLKAVYDFGETHDLSLLTDFLIPGGHAQALECLALAARILDAEGVFIDQCDGVKLYFILRHFRSI